MKKIFVDLDSTLTDFDKMLAKTLNKPLRRDWDFGNDSKIWKKIDNAGEKFWADMDFLPDGQELWNYLKKFKPTVLTSPSRHSSSKIGKRAWMKENLPKVPCIIAEEKQEYAKEGYILIDDREKNIKKWEEAGGTGIHHKSARDSIKKLKKIMEDKTDKQSMVNLIDRAANEFEAAGLIQEAYDLDIIANTIDKDTSLDNF